MKDILFILEDVPENELLEKIDVLTDEGLLRIVEGNYGIRYRKGR